MYACSMAGTYWLYSFDDLVLLHAGEYTFSYVGCFKDKKWWNRALSDDYEKDIDNNSVEYCGGWCGARGIHSYAIEYFRLPSNILQRYALQNVKLCLSSKELMISNYSPETYSITIQTGFIENGLTK